MVFSSVIKSLGVFFCNIKKLNYAILFFLLFCSTKIFCASEIWVLNLMDGSVKCELLYKNKLVEPGKEFKSHDFNKLNSVQNKVLLTFSVSGIGSKEILVDHDSLYVCILVEPYKKMLVDQAPAIGVPGSVLPASSVGVSVPAAQVAQVSNSIFVMNEKGLSKSISSIRARVDKFKNKFVEFKSKALGKLEFNKKNTLDSLFKIYENTGLDGLNRKITEFDNSNKSFYDAIKEFFGSRANEFKAFIGIDNFQAGYLQLLNFAIEVAKQAEKNVKEVETVVTFENRANNGYYANKYFNDLLGRDFIEQEKKIDAKIGEYNKKEEIEISGKIKGITDQMQGIEDKTSSEFLSKKENKELEEKRISDLYFATEKRVNERTEQLNELIKSSQDDIKALESKITERASKISQDHIEHIITEKFKFINDILSSDKEVFDFLKINLGTAIFPGKFNRETRSFHIFLFDILILRDLLQKNADKYKDKIKKIEDIYNMFNFVINVYSRAKYNSFKKLEVNLNIKNFIYFQKNIYPVLLEEIKSIVNKKEENEIEQFLKAKSVFNEIKNLAESRNVNLKEFIEYSKAYIKEQKQKKSGFSFGDKDLKEVYDKFSEGFQAISHDLKNIADKLGLTEMFNKIDLKKIFSGLVESLQSGSPEKKEEKLKREVVLEVPEDAQIVASQPSGQGVLYGQESSKVKEPAKKEDAGSAKEGAKEKKGDINTEIGQLMGELKNHPFFGVIKSAIEGMLKDKPELNKVYMRLSE